MSRSLSFATKFLGLLGTVTCLTLSMEAGAVVIGNANESFDFPDGAVSFADRVVRYIPGIQDGTPDLTYRNPDNALGVPDYLSGFSCPSASDCSFVSLGNGGILEVEFVDNFLTGSGDDSPDLFIFEVGPAAEATFVWVSEDQTIWHSVGLIFGSTKVLDLDFYGFGTDDLFRFVRLQDLYDPDAVTEPTLGADIDAVGAISSRPITAAPVPVPAAIWLLGSSLISLVVARRRKNQSV